MPSLLLRFVLCCIGDVNASDDIAIASIVNNTSSGILLGNTVVILLLFMVLFASGEFTG